MHISLPEQDPKYVKNKHIPKYLSGVGTLEKRVVFMKDGICQH